ncbi:MAG: hypothetical protein WBZ57_20615 [Pseudomonas graminis]
MTKKTTIEVTAAVEAAAANVAALETKLRTADQESIRAQALAIALPGRLASGDETVTTADLIHAGPAVAVAQAKVTALGQQVAAAREALEMARAAELVAQLRAGDPFISRAQVGDELDRIAGYVVRELGKLGARIEAHNQAFYAVAGSLPKGADYVFPAGPDGDRLSIRHDSNGKVIELDGLEWWAMSTDGWGRDVLSRVVMAEARQRDAAREPAPLFMTGFDGIDPETLAEMIA